MGLVEKSLWMGKEKGKEQKRDKGIGRKEKVNGPGRQKEKREKKRFKEIRKKIRRVVKKWHSTT